MPPKEEPTVVVTSEIVVGVDDDENIDPGYAKGGKDGRASRAPRETTQIWRQQVN